MKYNPKYGRWFSKSGLIYRYDAKLDKLVLYTRECVYYNRHGKCSWEA